jgi:succinyl-CoA synthetase alpha subunit
MLDINTLREREPMIIALGNHPGIIQSILDFDHLAGKETSSVKAIIATGRKYARYFFGRKEMLIPVIPSLSQLSEGIRKEANLFVNLTSARRVLQSTIEIVEYCPSMLGGTIFAEDVPEAHSISLSHFIREQQKFLIGPASVGLLLPHQLKLGAIGGVDPRQLIASRLFTQGDVAIFSASGGMTNEIIRIAALKQKHLSFALSFGGDRFPVLSPQDAFLLAEEDPQTRTIIYYGELGGTDEYELAGLLREKKITKQVIAYIAGTVSDIFPTPPQFGHAKAMAKTHEESALAKRTALRDAGAIVPESFSQFVDEIAKIETVSKIQDFSYTTEIMTQFENRKQALITTGISNDENGTVKILGEDLLSFAESRSFANISASLFLGRKIKSHEFEELVDFILRLSVDHGPHVSGAVNTIIASRAGKDLVSSLSAGLLTIGPRFGGAINQGAANWLRGVTEQHQPADFVEEFAKQKIYLAGIGHRKYRIDLPDPRVKKLVSFADRLEKKRFISFALEVEKITTAKKGNLILNVDGTIGALLLDFLSEKEGYTDAQLKELVDTEFFNALFVLSRSVGFIAHFLDQKRLDEGLFRLDADMVVSVDSSSEE